MIPQIRIFPDAASLVEAAAGEIARRIEAAVPGSGAGTAGRRFSIGLSGGNTPRPVYAALADRYAGPDAESDAGRVAWERVHMFWGDERYVPYDSPQSNYRMAREAMLDRLPIPGANVHPIPTSYPDPEDAARAYESTLREFFNAPFPAFDLNILGIGNDGHTASLFPGAATLHERERAVVVAHASAEPSTRITLTMPVLERAAVTLFLVNGADKHEVVRAILDNRSEARNHYPAAMLEPAGEVVWMIGER